MEEGGGGGAAGAAGAGGEGGAEEGGGLSAMQSVMFCGVVGLFASTLNLGFVLGGSMVEAAEAAGASSLVSADVVWLFAFTIAGAVNCGYAACLARTRLDVAPRASMCRALVDGGACPCM